MSKGKLTSRPPRAGPGRVEEFLGGAGTPTPGDKVSTAAVKAKPSARYPWEEPPVRQDVTKVFNLRLPESYLLKLKYLAEHTPDSRQQFCLKVLLPAIDAQIEELTQKDR